MKKIALYMFVNAIETVAPFTTPIHTITRNYKETFVSAGAATLFFVNEFGVAVTCKHVMNLVGNRQAINQHYQHFQSELNALGKNKLNQKLKALETKYNYTENSIIQIKELFLNVSSEPTLQFRWINHPKYDLSIVIFENLRNPLYQSHATFVKDSTQLKQGKYLCRLGFPFPEFTNYQYNTHTDDIEFTNFGQIETPRFPIEGMLTRHLQQDGEIMGIELSTPGLRGQSGGPLFNSDGLVCGMQAGTNHLHLGFDMRQADLKVNGRSIKVNNQPFLHVGHCVHVDIIKQFLAEHQIKFYEA